MKIVLSEAEELVIEFSGTEYQLCVDNRLEFRSRLSVRVLPIPEGEEEDPGHPGLEIWSKIIQYKEETIDDHVPIHYVTERGNWHTICGEGVGKLATFFTGIKSNTTCKECLRIMEEKGLK